MLRIIKYVSMQEAPVLISHHHQGELDKAKEDLCGGSPDELQAPAKVEDITQEQAAAILAEAKGQAQLYMEQAAQQAEEARQESYQQGLAQGKSEGIDLGYQEGFAKGQEEAVLNNQRVFDEAVSRASKIIAEAEQAAQAMIQAAERDIVEIGLAVANKIIIRQLTNDPEAIMPIVAEALKKVRDKEQVVIRVNPEDYDIVLAGRRDLQLVAGGEQTLTITADHTVSRGGCVIDTSHGSVDARIDTQLDMIKKALQDVMP